MYESGKTIKFPFGKATVVTMAADADSDIIVDNNLTYVDGKTNPASANRELSLTPDDELEVGAEVMVAVKTAANEETTFAGDVAAETITGVAGKTFTVKLFFDGANFLQIGDAAQID